VEPAVEQPATSPTMSNAMAGRRIRHLPRDAECGSVLQLPGVVLASPIRTASALSPLSAP
jgi:hypothetical protein